jgi:hypothetical protein
MARRRWSFFVLAGLIVLPLVELVLPISTGINSSKSITRRPSLLVPLAALTITVVLITSGLAVDRFDPNHPRQTHLMDAMDADSGTAMWASQDQDPDPWTAAYVPNANGNSEPPIPLLMEQSRIGWAPRRFSQSIRLGLISWSPEATVTPQPCGCGLHRCEGPMSSTFCRPSSRERDDQRR